MLVPRDGYELDYEPVDQTIYILKGSSRVGVIHASQMRYAEFDPSDAYEFKVGVELSSSDRTKLLAEILDVATVPEPEPTTPSVAEPAPVKRRGRPPKKPVE